LITYLCSLIISDSVAVEIFAIGQLCAKIFRKVRCATFLRHGVLEQEQKEPNGSLGSPFDKRLPKSTARSITV